MSIFIIFLLHAFHLSVVAEDAFISFRFAKHLIMGHGLTWNVGEPPVEGYTNFLWVILCALFLRTNLNIIFMVQTAGVVASAATLLYAFLFCRKLLRYGPFVSLLPCLFLAMNGPFATWAMSGMETNLFAFFIVAACFHQVSHWISGKTISRNVSFLFCLLATLTRPEGVILFGVIVIVNFFRIFRQREAGQVQGFLISAFLLYVFPLAIYMSWRLSYYGYLLPNTYYAKTGGTIYQWYRGLKYCLYFSFHFLLPVSPLLLGGAWKFARSIRMTSKEGRHGHGKGGRLDDSFFGIILCVGMCIAYTAGIIWVGGDYMAMYRFFVPVLPLIYIIITACCLILLNEISSKRGTVVTGLLVVGLLGTFLQSTPFEPLLFAKPEFTLGQYRGVSEEKWHSNRLTLIGNFFNRYKRNEQESLATEAIGAISYYSNLKIYDLTGLQDLYIAHKKQENMGKGFPGHERYDLSYALSKKPTFIVYSRDLSEKPQGFPMFDPDVETRARQDYRLISIWLEDKENGESGYFNFLQRKDR